jgi:RHS repeat-associated protein
VSGRSYYYVHTDHLNSPRKVAQPTTGTLAWRWDSDPFGTAAPNQNPAGLGTFAYNLRFPGQYYQAETGLNYNDERDLDSLTGRYIESDPVGLVGGLHSTYLYAHGDPISNIDPSGLAPPGRTGTPTLPSLIPPDIAWPGSPTNTAWAQGMAEQIDSALTDIAAAIHNFCTSDKEKQCEELLRIDTDTCNAITRRRGARAGAACHESATERYAACLRGKPLPPLNTWNN